jgi:hypothetical protein
VQAPCQQATAQVSCNLWWSGVTAHIAEPPKAGNYGPCEGTCEQPVGDEFRFIFSEVSDFEEPDVNFSSMSGDGGTTLPGGNDACTGEDLAGPEIAVSLGTHLESPIDGVRKPPPLGGGQG